MAFVMKRVFVTSLLVVLLFLIACAPDESSPGEEALVGKGHEGFSLGGDKAKISEEFELDSDLISDKIRPALLEKWELGHSCIAHFQCQTGICGKTDEGHFVCEKINGLNQVCGSSSECGMNSCYKGLCIKKTKTYVSGATPQDGQPAGSWCTENRHCLSEICSLSNRCVLPLLNGDYCFDNHECLSGICVGEVDRETLANYRVCRDTETKAVGETCSVDTGCDSGICGYEMVSIHRFNKVISVPYSECSNGQEPLGSRCKFDSECASGKCDVNTTAYYGSQCEYPNAEDHTIFYSIEEAEAGNCNRISRVPGKCVKNPLIKDIGLEEDPVGPDFIGN
jgi:hypothetical protein